MKNLILTVLVCVFTLPQKANAYASNQEEAKRLGDYYNYLYSGVDVPIRRYNQISLTAWDYTFQEDENDGAIKMVRTGGTKVWLNDNQNIALYVDTKRRVVERRRPFQWIEFKANAEHLGLDAKNVKIMRLYKNGELIGEANCFGSARSCLIIETFYTPQIRHNGWQIFTYEMKFYGQVLSSQELIQLGESKITISLIGAN